MPTARAGATITLLILMLITTSCAVHGRKAESWIGADVSELIKDWGPPPVIYSDGQGGRILVYTNRQRVAYQPAVATPLVRDPRPLSYRMFWVDAQGRIYKWQWKGR